MTGRLQGFEEVFGQAEGVLEASMPHALLPFTFYLHATHAQTLRVHVSDFHSNTWQVERTPEQLEDLRDEVGIGGSWSEFLQYLRDAFSSNNVKLTLGGPATSVGGHGATFAKVTAQKAKGTPRVSLVLEKCTAASAKDVMGNIAFQLLRSFKEQSDALAAERARTSQLLQALATEKEKAQQLQNQVDALSFTGKRKSRRGSQSQYFSSFDVTGASLSQYDTQPPLLPQASAGPNDSKAKEASKPAVTRNKAHMAHAKRTKQRGTHLADIEENE